MILPVPLVLGFQIVLADGSSSCELRPRVLAAGGSKGGTCLIEELLGESL
jgi:hypothetical protein